MQAVQQEQAARTELVARVSPAVCSVMGMATEGGGSGVIIDPLGFVLTNFHVVVARKERPKAKDPEAKDPEDNDSEDKKAEAKKPAAAWDPAQKVMKIGLPDGELYTADVLGIDPGSDLAVLLLRPRADGKPYPYVQLGDSDQLLVGEAVFALGNPFLLATDFTPTLSWGIVSGTHRYQPGQGNRMLVYPDCIQVDAPVNPGNSGGPLFNMKGHVVGINGRISLRDRGRVNTGVGFAISSNQIGNFLADLMAGKHAEHGTLDLNAQYRKATGETEPQVVVDSIFEDSRAAILGLKLGDQLTAFNGIAIKSANQLATLVGVLPAGSWVELHYRPLLEEAGKGFGEEQKIGLKLSKLDTGSSRNPDRLASQDVRKLAAQALTRQVGSGAIADGATLEMYDPIQTDVTIQRLGQQLRLQYYGWALVRTAPGQGFKQTSSGVQKLSREEQAKLEREFACNPWLWRGADRQLHLKDALLKAGLLVRGKPACRLRLPGKGERYQYYFADGSPAGFSYRDPTTRDIRSITAGLLKQAPVYEPLPESSQFSRPE